MSPRRFKFVTLAVYIAATLTALALVAASAWAWREPGTHPFFRFGLPALLIWLMVATARLAFGLRRQQREARATLDPLKALATAPKAIASPELRKAYPGAESYRQILLPPEPGSRRPRIVRHISFGDGRQRYVVTSRRKRRSR